jgi:hypothetical protein
MADTICHGVQGGLMVAAPLVSRVKNKVMLGSLIGAGFLMGALPDLIGAEGNLLEHDHWAAYRTAHFGSVAHWLQYVPMYWLHLQIDALTHGKGHRWWVWNERLWLELLLWCINLLLILWLVRLWERSRRPEGTDHLQPQSHM